MGRSLALLHTVRSVYESFGDRLSARLADLSIYNMLDDFLAIDANRRGEFTAGNLQRLKHDLASLDGTGADAIVVTCSTLSPWLPEAAQGTKRPVFAIDDAMTSQAARHGGRILVMATAKSAVAPVREAIISKARGYGTSPSISALTCVEAMTALRAGDSQRHDALLLEAVRSIQDVDLIVLAQASMAHMEAAIAGVTGCQVLQSPSLCIDQVISYVEGLEHA